jgi:hypothetical protein
MRSVRVTLNASHQWQVTRTVRSSSKYQDVDGSTIPLNRKIDPNVATAYAMFFIQQ